MITIISYVIIGIVVGLLAAAAIIAMSMK